MIPQDKLNGIDPREWFFGAMLMLPTEQQFEYYHQLKPQWFTVKQHRDLYECLKYCVENQLEFNLISAARWFKEHDRFSTVFKLSNLSQLTQNVGHPKYDMIQLCLTEIVYIYFFEATQTFYSKVGHQLGQQSFDLDKVREVFDLYNKQLNEDYIEETEISNAELVGEILVSHEKAAKGEFDGISIGFNSLKHVLLEFVDFMVIGARPAMGKTAFVLSSIYNMIFQENKNVALFSLEMSKQQIMRRIISIGTGIPDEKIKLGKCTDQELLSIEQFKKKPFLNNLTIYEGTHKPTDVIRKITLLNQKQKVEAVFIDYLQKLAPEKTSMKMIEHVSNASNQMKNLAMNLKIPVIALAQLSRSVENRGGDKRPVLSDLRESGEIEQDASIVAFLHRPEYYGQMEDENGESTEGIGQFVLAKNRGGKVGVTRMKFQGELMKWSDHEVVYNIGNMQPNRDFDFVQQKMDQNFDESPF